MVRLKSVEILFIDEEGNEDFKEYHVGNEEVVGDTLHESKTATMSPSGHTWRVDRIEGLKVKVDNIKEEAVKLLNAILNESNIRYNPTKNEEEIIIKSGLFNDISNFINGNNLRNARMRGNGGR